MEGWANVKRHVAAEITLLCDNHHRERTNGLLPLSIVQQANKNPHNRCKGVSPPFQFRLAPKDGDFVCELNMGSVVVTSTRFREFGKMTAVAIDGEDVLGFSFEQGHLLLNLLAYDHAGQLIASIEKNELRYLVTPWDIVLEGRQFTIRKGQGDILLDIKFDPPKVHIRHCQLFRNGWKFKVNPNYVEINDALRWSDCVMEGFAVAYWLADRPSPLACCFFVRPPPLAPTPATDNGP